MPAVQCSVGRLNKEYQDGLGEYGFPGAVGPQAKERGLPDLPPRDPTTIGRNVMMIEALDGVSWSPSYACPFSETGPRKSEDGRTKSTRAISGTRALWSLK